MSSETLRSLDPLGIGSLRSSEELFRALTAHNPVGAFVSDAAGRCLYVNARWCELAGLAEEEALGDGWSKALHPDDADRVLGEWAAAARDGCTSVVEYRFRRPDGDVSWIQGFASPLHAADGTIAGWVGTCVDLTDRHKRERQQEAAAQLGLRALSADDVGAVVRDAVETAAAGLGVEFASFLEMQDDGETLILRGPCGWADEGRTIVVDLDGPSPAAQALRGKAPVVVEHEHGSSADRRSPFLKEHGVASSAAVAVPGDERPCGVLAAHSTRAHAFDHNDLSFLGAVANVLAAAFVRERTLESSKRLAAIVNSSDDAITGTTIDGVVTSWNAGAERMYGYAADEVIGRSIDFLIPDDRAEELEHMLEQLRRGDRISNYETVRVAKSGRRVAISLTISPTLDADGAVMGSSAIARDISKRKLAEEELRRSEARYRDLFENASDLIATTDLDSRLTSVNSAFARTLGYTPEELLGKPLAELVPAQWHGQLAEAKEQKLERGRDATVYDHELLAKDGRRIQVEVATRLIVEDGRPVGTEAICRDITERRRVEKALRESEERYRLVVEQADDLIALLDQDGCVVYASPSHEKVLGYTPEECIGRPVLDFLHPDDRAEAAATLESRSDEPPAGSSVWRGRRKDGTWIYIEGSATPVGSAVGGDVAYLTVSRDVSARVHAERALRESEERFRAIFESSPHGMDIVDADGRLLAANAALERLLGYDKEELASMRFGDFTHPDDIAADMALHEDVVRGDRVSYELEKRYVRKDGSIVWVHLTSFCVHDAEGEARFIGIVEDISERKALEQQLRQAQKMEAVGQLAGGIAHDFNNLLTVINGYADRALDSTDPAKVHESLAEVVKAGTSAAALTRQLLAFSRQQVLQPRVVGLGEVIGNVERMLRRVLGEDIAMETALDPGLGKIRVDPNQIEQVLLNLAVNARDAMPNGGRLRIAAANTVVDATYAATHVDLEPGRYAELTVADDGIGMDEQTRSRVFDPFFTTKSHGTGLGLATVYGIVKQSGGNISVYSEEGSGTTFRLLFPLVDAAGEPALSENARSESSTGTETILVVEDAEPVRRLTAEILETLGYTVAIAGDADEALDVAATCEPLHLVMSDVMLPGRSGPELVEEIQRLRPGTRSLFTSGYAPSLAAQRGGLDPDQPFLAKPFTMAALASIVRQVLDG